MIAMSRADASATGDRLPSGVPSGVIVAAPPPRNTFCTTGTKLERPVTKRHEARPRVLAHAGVLVAVGVLGGAEVPVVLEVVALVHPRDRADRPEDQRSATRSLWTCRAIAGSASRRGR